MNKTNERLLAFYGDDFTGSTDALEALSGAGIRAALFFEPPSRETLRQRFGDLQVVGIAGVSRAMTPAQMDATLPEVFALIRHLGAALFHYKVCSTFDSAPEVGSIGHAIDIGQRTFSSRFVSLLIGAPALKRYTLFGNHFATVAGETFRLDRHPTMRRHPTTPMHESDLRLHLSKQTDKTIALMDILHLTGEPKELDARLDALLEREPDIVLFDVLDDARLAEVGRLMWERRSSGARFIVGSSGVEYALAAHWRTMNLIEQRPAFESPHRVEQLIVVSGSCSPVTKEQTESAFAQGFVGIAVDGARLVESEACDAERARVVSTALKKLEAGHSIIIHSALGPNDARIEATTNTLLARKLDARDASQLIGRQLGIILRSLLERTHLSRVVVAGGDTSGYVAHELGIRALEMIAPISPGAPLCRAHLSEGSFDTLEIALKGGQLGATDFFECVRRGAS